MENKNEFKPYIPAEKVTPELTLTSIIMGVISAPVAVFYVYTIIKGWVSIFWYDYPEVKLPASREMREKEEEHDKLVRWFLAVFLILFSIGLPIGGILKLVEYFGK